MYRVVDAVDAGFPGAWTIIRTYREVWQTRKTGKKDKCGRDVRKAFGKPTKEVAYHVSSLDPDSQSAERFAEIVRTHWYVEAYHGKRDNGYHEDVFTRRGFGPLNGRDCGQGLRSRTIRLAVRQKFQRSAVLESDRSSQPNENSMSMSLRTAVGIFAIISYPAKVAADPKGLPPVPSGTSTRKTLADCCSLETTNF